MRMNRYQIKKSGFSFWSMMMGVKITKNNLFKSNKYKLRIRWIRSNPQALILKNLWLITRKK